MLKRIMLIFAACLVVLSMIVAAALFSLKMQISRYANYWQEQASHQESAQASKYIALGDSTAQGIGASRPQNGYIGLLTQAIASKSGRAVHVINISKSGATIKDVTRDQLPMLSGKDASSSTIITLDVGANDIAKGFSASTFRNDIADLLSKLPKNVIVGEVPSFRLTRMQSKNTDVQAANVILNEEANKYNLRVAPLYVATSQKKTWLDNAIDLFHPSDRGYKNWFNAFWHVLEAQIH